MIEIVGYLYAIVVPIVGYFGGYMHFGITVCWTVGLLLIIKGYFRGNGTEIVIGALIMAVIATSVVCEFAAAHLTIILK